MRLISWLFLYVCLKSIIPICCPQRIVKGILNIVGKIREHICTNRPLTTFSQRGHLYPGRQRLYSKAQNNQRKELKYMLIWNISFLPLIYLSVKIKSS